MRFKTHSLIDFDNSTTYTGLVDLIQRSSIHPVELEDLRVFPELVLNTPNLTQALRSYQIDYLIAALKERRLIVHAEGGSGKSLILAAILDTLDLPTLIIAPDKTVLAQLEVELRALMPHRTFNTTLDKKFEFKPMNTIGLAGKLGDLTPKELKYFKVLLVDEAHRVAAQQAHDIVLKTNAPYRFGFTASPKGRSDNRDLVVEGLLGPIVKLIERQELIANKWLADIDVEVHRGWWEGDFPMVEDLLIVKNQKRNQLILNLIAQHRRSTILVLVKRIDHGQLLAKNIRNAVFISGDSEASQREEVRQAMKSGEIKIVIASKIFGTGLDIPNLDVLINARGGKSDIDTIQGSARLNRPWPDSIKLLIDIYDGYHPMLEEHSRLRVELYKSQGIKPKFVDFPPGLEKKLREE